MAKKSSIEKNNRRARMAKQTAAKRARLKAMPLAPNGGVPVVVSSGSCFQTVPAPPCGPVFQMIPWKESET